MFTASKPKKSPSNPRTKANGIAPRLTPDGRYLIVRDRLWRSSNPHLDPETREQLVADLMSARRAKGSAMRREDAPGRDAARQAVDLAKRALGERGPVWWTDGAPDLNRHLVRNTAYADWYARCQPNEVK